MSMPRSFTYPVRLTGARGERGLTATFRDVPEAIAQGEDEAAALAEAADALEEAVAGRMRLGEDIPPASTARRGERLVALPALTASKAALYLSLRAARLSKLGLAKRLGRDEKDVRRMLDPDHASKLEAIEGALRYLGKRLRVTIEDAA